MKIGLALGGGGVRGMAHVAALEVLDACGIRPCRVAGTSMGAIVGALYTAGMSGREIRDRLDEHIIAANDGFRDIIRKKRNLVRWLAAVRPSWDSRGLLRADGFLHYLLEMIDAERFEDLEIPLHVVATDFHSGQPVVFTSGELLPAIRASMSIPGVFVPVEHEGRVLVDGGVVNNLPYNVLQDTCDVTIAIDVTPTRIPSDAGPPNMVEATLGMFDTMIETITGAMRSASPPTLYVRPRLTGIRVLDFDKIERVFEQARPVMERFKRALENGLDKAPASITD